jgi:hypothetical protein
MYRSPDSQSRHPVSLQALPGVGHELPGCPLVYWQSIISFEKIAGSALAVKDVADSSLTGAMSDKAAKQA